jgi:hypothetical protein
MSLTEHDSAGAPGKRWQRRNSRLALVAGFTVAVASLTACLGDDSAQPPGSPTPVPSGTITATGSIAYITPEKGLGLIEPDGVAQQVIYDSDEVVAFEWSPDGALIAVDARSGSGRKVVVLTANGDFRFDLAASSEPLWSPIGDRLIVMRADGAVVVDTNGQELATYPGAAMPVWARDGSEIAYLKVASDGMAVPMIVNPDSGVERGFGSDIEPSEPIYPIAWHPAGDVIAYKDALYEPATRTLRPLEGVPVGWSPDGRILLQTTDTDPATGATTAELLDFSRGGRVTIGLDVRATPLEEPPWLHVNRWIDWSDDGRLLVYLDPQPGRVQVRIYDTVAITQERYQNIQGTEPDVSPSATHVAFFDSGHLWVFALDGTALVNIVGGTYPAWRP